jgi:hypothetical protein
MIYRDAEVKLTVFVSHNNRIEGKLHVQQIISVGDDSVVIILACFP